MGSEILTKEAKEEEDSQVYSIAARHMIRMMMMMIGRGSEQHQPSVNPSFPQTSPTVVIADADSPEMMAL